MRTEQEKHLKNLLNNALSLVKNTTSFIDSIQIDDASIKGMSKEQLADLQKQTEQIKQSTKLAEVEIEKLTKNDSSRK